MITSASALAPVFASLTQPLVDFAVSVIDKLGLGGIAVLMFFESACVPIPSEATMLFAGFNVSDGRFSLFAITAVGVLANLAGSWLAYGVGYLGRVDLIEKHGRKVLINPKHLEWADHWFARHGEATVFFTRMLPIVRTFISLPAGVARMPFWRFTLFTLLGCIPWVFALGFAGMQLGSNWEDLQSKLHYADYAIAAAIVAGIAYLVVRRLRGGRPDPDAAAEAAPRGETAAEQTR